MIKDAFNIVLCSFLSSLILTCSSPTKPDRVQSFPNQLQADVAHAVLKTDGTVWAWGWNDTGLLGNGTTKSSSIPKKVRNLENIITFKLKEGIGLAADLSGNIWFWGNNVLWLSGPGLDTVVTTPKRISYLPGTTSIVIRASTFDLLRNDGTVWRLKWEPRSPTKFLHPSKIANLNNISAISGHLALKKDGTVCLLADEWVPANRGGYLPGLDNVKAIENVWRMHTFVLKTDGTVWSWGRHDLGTSGTGTTHDSDQPVQVKNLNDIVAISANGSRRLALKDDGTVWYWGLKELDIDNDIRIIQNSPLQIQEFNNACLVYAAAAVKSLIKKDDDTYWTFDFKDNMLERIWLHD